MKVKVTLEYGSTEEIIELCLSNKYKAIFDLNYQEMFYNAWFNLCLSLYWGEIARAGQIIAGRDIYVEDMDSNIKGKLHICNVLDSIKPRLIF